MNWKEIEKRLRKLEQKPDGTNNGGVCVFFGDKHHTGPRPEKATLVVRFDAEDEGL